MEAGELVNATDVCKQNDSVECESGQSGEKNPDLSSFRFGSFFQTPNGGVIKFMTQFRECKKYFDIKFYYVHL